MEPCLPRPLGLAPSFGFGDRLGLATPGHLDALRSHGGPIKPVFAQQSMREMERLRRTPSDVIAGVVAALRAASYKGPWGADADRLTTQEEVNRAAGAGFVFFTIDPCDHIDPDAGEYNAAALSRRFRELQGDVNWTEQYLGRSVQIEGGPRIEFRPDAVYRAAVKYGRAIAHAAKLAAHIDRVMAKRTSDYEIELCVDRSPKPVTLAEHYIIAQQSLRSNMKLVSLALRYPGQFEKGIDYKGDLAALEAALRGHAAVARTLGPYKLSLHSGSDKLSMYEILARATGGLFHVKTSGTSYLEALRVAARHNRKLFRRIVDFSRERFERDRAGCQVSARLEKVPTPAAVSDDAKLEKLYLDQGDGRQVLHVTFGSVLTDSALGPALRDVLVAQPETHRQVLARHFGRHLKALCKGLA